LASPSRSTPRGSTSGAPWPAKKMSTVSSFFAERPRKVPSAHLTLRSVGLRSVLSVSSNTWSFLKPPGPISTW
jgi:hypothetical protein